MFYNRESWNFEIDHSQLYVLPFIMAFEDILQEIGQFGTYQKRIYILLCYPALFLSGLMVVNVFLLGIPEHRLVQTLRTNVVRRRRNPNCIQYLESMF